MSVRGGREFLAVPGPTTIPDEVLQAMQCPAVEIFSKSLIATTVYCATSADCSRLRGTVTSTSLTGTARGKRR
jgi:alanine-glyoxylate transaminase / serine-glyoxylate transaminase / serine-pyruvate transaminase